MNNDQQFWTAFKEVAQAAPPQQPREDQWEALLQNLPASKRRFPLRGWLGINLLGLLLIWSLGSLSAPLNSNIPVHSDQTINKSSEHSKVQNSGHSKMQNPGHSMMQNSGQSMQNSGHSKMQNSGHSMMQNSGHSMMQNSGHSKMQNSGHSKVLRQATDTSRSYQLPATDYSRQTPHYATPLLPTHLYPVVNSPIIPSPQNYAAAQSSISLPPSTQLSLLLHPFQTLDGNQGMQPEIQLSRRLPFLGLRAAFRLSQVESYRSWAALPEEQLDTYQTQVPGLLTDAAQQEQALVIGLEINRPLLTGKGRFQISPGIGTSFRLFGRRDHRLQSITEYSTGQTAVLTNFSTRDGFDYWATYLGLQVQYQLKGRLGLVAQSRYWFKSRQLVPGQATSLGIGLTYRIE